VRRRVKMAEFRYVMLIEIVARVLKNNIRLRLRERMKKLKKPLEEPYRRLVINYMNLVFGNSENSEKYWNLCIKDDIQRNFILVNSSHVLTRAIFRV
jgi:hypothetical protein